MEQLIPIKTFLAKAGISKATLRRLWLDGRGPERVRIGRRVLISESAAARWLASRTEQPAGTART
jgi:predicted DNA-binding transcriptional regulator AlpA